MAKILIVDDHISFRTVLAETVSSLKHEVLEAGTGAEALTVLDSQIPHLVLLDLRLPDMSGLDVLKRIRERTERNNLPVVILTAYADSSNTIEAMKLGAFDHITKPVAREDLKKVITRALTSFEQTESKKPMHEALDRKHLIGESAAFRDVEKLVGLALTTSTPVMLLGETGTGKEKIARTIYEHSELTAPFLSIPCASPQDGFESFDQQGMVYLKELADLDPARQVQLLNLLPIDSKGPRVISSSCQDLDALVKRGNFREDLYYRLSVFLIPVPPLRKRSSDVLVLAEGFLYQVCPDNPKRLTPAAAKALLEYNWPGNVRELLNIMLTSSVVARGQVIDVENLPFAQQGSMSEVTLTDLLHLDYHGAISRLEKMLLQKALEDATGNRTEAARSLGINRQLLYSKLKEHSIE